MEENDLSWIPPSETEMKVIQAKRERSDKIAKIMAQYLLKGYKMLSSSCETCETVLLQDRQGELYCVGCCEIDNEHTKDNPVLNGIAAMRKIQESDHRSCNDLTATTETATLLSNQPTGTSAEAKMKTNTTISSVSVTDDTNAWITNAENTLKSTMIMATEHLKSCSCVDNCIKYCTLVKACADALSSLNALRNTLL